MLVTVRRENFHTFRVNENEESYFKLLKAVRGVFAIPSKEEVKLCYRDEDGDEILVGSFAELLEAKRLMPDEVKLELKNQNNASSFLLPKPNVKREKKENDEKKPDPFRFRDAFFEQLRAKKPSAETSSRKFSSETLQGSREGSPTNWRWTAETSSTSCSTVRPQKLISSQSGRGKGRITLTCSTCKLRKERGKALVKGVFVFFFFFLTTFAVMDTLFIETEQKASPEIISRLQALGVSEERWVERLYDGFDCDEKELLELLTAMENERYRTITILTSPKECGEDGIAETVDSYIWAGVEVWRGFPLHSRIIILLLSALLSLFVLGPLPLVIFLFVLPVYYFCGGWKPLIAMVF